MLNDELEYNKWNKITLFLLVSILISMITIDIRYVKCESEVGLYEFKGIKIVKNVEIGRMECIK